MTTITEKLAEALLGMTRALDLKYPGTDHKPGHWREPYDAAMATLAEYEATQRVYFPADYIREKLEKYDAEIADGTVSYPFYAGCFSQVVRGMMERVS